MSILCYHFVIKPCEIWIANASGVITSRGSNNNEIIEFYKFNRIRSGVCFRRGAFWAWVWKFCRIFMYFFLNFLKITMINLSFFELCSGWVFASSAFWRGDITVVFQERPERNFRKSAGTLVTKDRVWKKQFFLNFKNILK